MQNFFYSEFSKAIPNEFITDFPGGIGLWIKREDLLHPEVSGNKFRKLKYNLLAAREQNKDALLTFGGAHSNHIAAAAAAGKKFGFKTIGVIRGNELGENKERWSPTLQYANSCGMRFHFISREEYRKKNSEEFTDTLKEGFGDFYLLPEGGTNELAIKGCEEILTEEDKQFNFICSSVGTGGTLSGLINSSKNDQRILGFSSLKSNHLRDEVAQLVDRSNWEMILNFHFGGYAKVNVQLIEFLNEFNKKYKIKLDPVYTGKLVFGIFELISKGYFPENSRILAIHTGGLQGVAGMNNLLRKKDLPQINF